VSKLTVGTGLAAAIALIGLALSLTNYKNETLARWLLIGAGVVFVVCAVASLVRYVRTGFERAVDSRVQQTLRATAANLTEAAAPNTPEPQVPQPRPKQAVQPPSDTSASDLRAAINLVIGELEDAAAHIRADDHSFWSSEYLPTFEWGRHRDLIARHDDKAHEAARPAYREIDRVERCMQNQRTGNGMGDVWLPDDATVKRCRPKDAQIAIAQALYELRRMRDA
jgi:hypothetical protein